MSKQTVHIFSFFQSSRAENEPATIPVITPIETLDDLIVLGAGAQAGQVFCLQPGEDLALTPEFEEDGKAYTWRPKT